MVVSVRIPWQSESGEPVAVGAVVGSSAKSDFVAQLLIISLTTLTGALLLILMDPIFLHHQKLHRLTPASCPISSCSGASPYDSARMTRRIRRFWDLENNSLPHFAFTAPSPPKVKASPITAAGGSKIPPGHRWLKSHAFLPHLILPGIPTP